ncbi:conserved hypothetical protein [Methanocella paludicola SANAE]|uniref:Calcineurin-like phosphoesterase domain-containing protein n=1 Tax=Methanocella paludicola (strain DSM 17711 / JCM 13418 / NBRC 101707 / SANAE) TaxID=304371 RepID=D1YX34_METPS|nr:metallophosphoesterase [Methanocella paludicola]BAI61006.1 conserved hypothetical protein [Methanocella paludicola SANAE]
MNYCLLLFSDVHADIEALDALLSIAGSSDFAAHYGPISKTINLGDTLQRGYHPCEVVRRLKDVKNLVSVLGNHDESFLYHLSLLGNDRHSIRVHDSYFATDEYQGFFQGIGRTHVDMENKLYAVHGGPIDPAAIPAKEKTIDDEWIYSQTWQRISVIGESFIDYAGYNYLPSQAFDAVKSALGSDGFVIACGHNHKEAAFVQKNGEVEDVLNKLDSEEISLNGHKIKEKRLPINDDTNYLVRLGIAGPEGFLQYGWDTCYFGVLAEKDGAKTFYLLSFEMGRKKEEEIRRPQTQYYEC